MMYRDEVYVDSNVTNASVLLHVKCSPMTRDYITFNTKVWPIITFICYGFAPIVWLISCNVILYRQLSLRCIRNHISGTVSGFTRKCDKDMKSLTKMLIVVCVVFVTFAVPACVFLIIMPYVFTRTSPHDVAKQRLAWVMVASLLYCNNAINFIIYCVSGSLFRQEFRGLIFQTTTSVMKCFSRRIFPAGIGEDTGTVASIVGKRIATGTNVWSTRSDLSHVHKQKQ